MAKLSDLRTSRVDSPPRDYDRDYLQRMADQVNQFPHQSQFSYTTPESKVSAVPGTLGGNIHKGDVPKAWVKVSGEGATGWASLATNGDITRLETTLATPTTNVGYGGVVANYADHRITGVDASYVLVDGYDHELPSRYVTSNATGGKVTLHKGGDWLVAVQSSFSGVANTEYHFAVFLDGTETILETDRKLGTGGDVGSCSIVGILSVTSGQVVDVRGKTLSGSGNFAGIQQAQLVVSLQYET